MVVEQQEEQEEEEQQYALCLNMIVKNESHIIKDTLIKLLQKVKFDYWVISDTGSTDETREIITDFFKEVGIPGELYEDEWVDFAHNRNKALQHAFGISKYLLVFDADDEICGDFVLPELTKDSYGLQFGSYTRTQIVNNYKWWKYVGVLHECICPDDSRIDNASAEIIKGPYHVISGRTGNRNLDSNKYLKDAIILEKAYHDALDAKDNIYIRYCFYCANSYYDCQKYESAISWYKKTLENGGWVQEKYVSCLKLYNCYNNLGNNEAGFFYLVKSAEYDRERAECYYELIKHYSGLGLHDVAYGYYGVLRDFYNKSYLKTGLNNKLFVDVNVSDFFLPYYVIIISDNMRDYETGIQMYRIIFTKKCNIFDEWYIGNLLYNLQFFIKRVDEEDKTAFYLLFQEYIDFLLANNYPICKHHDVMNKYNKYGIITTSKWQAINEECSTSKKILIYTGFLNHLWNDTAISKNKNIGGSHKAVGYLARNLPKEYEIIISGDVEDEVVGNIRYVNRFKLQALLDVEKFHTIIVSRYVSFFLLFPKFKCYQLYLSAHDYEFINNLDKSDISVARIINDNIDYINGIIYLTPWHKYNMDIHLKLKKKIKFSIINNGIVVPLNKNSNKEYDFGVTVPSDNIVKKKWYCFIHSCHFKDRGLNRLDYLITSLKSNDLFSKFETIYINNIGLPIEEDRYGPTVDICNYSDNPALYEIPTINKIQHFSQTNADCNILYLHTKGLRYHVDIDQNINDWIDMMLFFLVKQYELCISKLDSGIQAVGCNYNLHSTIYTYDAPRHFSGNFWWTNSNYTKTLPLLIEKTENVVPHDAEFWLCQNNPTICDLHNSTNINHYYESYPSTMYADCPVITLAHSKIKNKFVWTTCSYRGLIVLLNLWDEILEVMPDATLDISSYEEFPNSQRGNVDFEIASIINRHSDSVRHHGQLNTEELYELISKAEYWLYTCTVCETSCITALEMLVQEVVCLYYPLGGLVDTIGEYGIKVNTGNEIQSIMNLSEERKVEMRINGKKYAMSCSWENRAKEWASVLGLNGLSNNKKNKMILNQFNNSSGIFIQIGAGAGDLDERANCRDGFTELVKKLPRQSIKKIILVEPNPLNIPLLKECWKDYPESIIYQIGIVPKNYQNSTIDLYYCPLDAPHYQVASINKSHVQKHYGDNCEIEKFIIPVKQLENFINEIITEEIELLSLDIEGIDAEILLDINFNNLKLKYLSFEHLHLGEHKENVLNHLKINNYEFVGSGVDHNGYDYLYINGHCNKFKNGKNKFKILNLILFSNENISRFKESYLKMMQLQKEYIKSYSGNNITFYFYCYKEDLEEEYIIEDNIIYIKGVESYVPGILEKTMKAFEITKNMEYDFLLRSNISTVVDYSKLNEVLYEIPDNVIYAGGSCRIHTWLDPDYGIHKVYNIPFVIGSSIILKKEGVNKLIENKFLLDETIIDDVAFGIFFSSFGDKPHGFDSYYHSNLDCMTNGVIFYRNRVSYEKENIDRTIEIDNMTNVIQEIIEREQRYIGQVK